MESAGQKKRIPPYLIPLLGAKLFDQCENTPQLQSQRFQHPLKPLSALVFDG